MQTNNQTDTDNRPAKDTDRQTEPEPQTALTAETKKDTFPLHKHPGWR